MKKLFVGLLSIFMVLGASILSACGQQTPQLQIYYNEQAVSGSIPLELDSSDPEGGYILLSAELTGVSGGEITASAVGGYESVIKVEEERSNGQRKFFKVTGLSETDNGPAAIVFRGSPGDVSQYVYVDVFSYVSAMTQKEDETENQFLVLGEKYLIDEKGIHSESGINDITDGQLIKFSPSQKSRRALKWQIQKKKAGGGFELVDVTEFVPDESVIEEAADGKQYVLLQATDTLGAQNATTTVRIEVLNTIASEVELGWNYDPASEVFDDMDADGNELGVKDNSHKLISNIWKNEPKYIGYAWVGYAGTELEITPNVYKKIVENGAVRYVRLAVTEAEKLVQKDQSLWLENNLVILKVGSTANYTIYSIKSATSENVSDYQISFNVGHVSYNYAGKTKNIYIDVMEKVNQVSVSTKGYLEIFGTPALGEAPNVIVDVYDNYATIEGVSRRGNGQLFNVSLSPNVLDGSNRYTISYDATNVVLDGGITEDGSTPIKLFYRAPNGNVVELEVVNEASLWYVGTRNADGGIVATEISAGGGIYIQASDKLRYQTTEKLTITFTSVDNENAATTFGLKLKKSASQDDFSAMTELQLEFDEASNDYKLVTYGLDPDGNPVYAEVDAALTGNLVIDSSAEGKVYRKAFKLSGQSNISDIKQINGIENVVVNNWKVLEFSNEVNNEYVIFSFDVILKPSAYGKTLKEFYSIDHANGSSTAFIDNATPPALRERFTFEIVLPFTDINIYPDMGENLSNSITSAKYSQTTNDIEYLMLKNNTVTPIIFSMKAINGNLPKIDYASVKYLSFEQYQAFEGAEKTIQDFMNLYYSSQVRDLESLTLHDAISDNLSSLKFDVDLVGTKGAILTKGVGYAYVIVSFGGQDEHGEERIKTKVILVESYNAPERMSVSRDADREVEVYAIDSVSSEHEQLTYKNIQIDFDNPNTTYCDVENINIRSIGNSLDAKYRIDSVQVGSSGLSFKITGLTTDGSNEITDSIVVEYIIKKAVDENKDGIIDQDEYGSDLYETVYKFEIALAITVKNAQRIESVKWTNADAEGLYYQIGSDERDAYSRYIILETAPTNAQNSSMHVVMTDNIGNPGLQFVTTNDRIAENTIAVNLDSDVKEGQTGYLYILPADAVFNGNLKYYYQSAKVSGTKIPFDSDVFSSTGEEVDVNVVNIKISEIALYYQELMTYGYFKSNNIEGAKNVAYKDVILKIKVEVADGSKEHPFRVFNETQFNAIQDNLHYVVMNDIILTEERYPFATFSGGLQGVTQNVTIKLNGYNFAGILEGSIENITFIGNVEGNGFVVDENKGTLSNVLVDTNGNMASVLTASGVAGGLAGQNSGTISGCGVLGLTISGSANVVGGLVGSNTGKIENCRVEFYNLQVDANTYAPNTISGTSVGALVGQMTDGSIYRAFAYDYTLSMANKTNRVLIGTNVDPLVETHTAGRVGYVFSVVGLSQTNVNNNLLLDYYLGYYSGEVYTLTKKGSNFITSAMEGFDGEINEGQPYFQDFHQEKAISAATIDGLQIKTTKENGYYKSIQTDILEGDIIDDNKGILFFYQTAVDKTDLSAAEQEDLVKLNTISISDLLGIGGDASGIIVISSDERIVKTKGSSIELCTTGNVDLTISSKYDVSLNKKINIKVVLAITNILISRVDENGQNIMVDENKHINIQKTKAIDVTAYQAKDYVNLGNLARKINLVTSEFAFESTSVAQDGNDDNKIKSTKNGNIIRLEAGENSVNSRIEVYPQMFTSEDDKIYQDAIYNEFKRSFIAKATEGLISFKLSGEQIPLTPSTVSEIKAKIETTALNDTVYPVIRLDGQTKPMERKLESDKYVYYNSLGQKVLSVSRQLVSSTDSKPYVYEYKLIFEVHSEYKNKVADDMRFIVYLMSASGSSSMSWGGSFTIILSRQTFTNIDVANMKIDSMIIDDGREIYTVKKYTSTLAPGNSSILKVNVNPEYAYYDYAEISYSGANVANAVNIEAVSAYAGGKYASLDAGTGTTERVGTKLRFIPAVNSETKDNLYFKIWINTTVDSDTTLMFTIAFYRNGQAEALDYVNYYLDVTYLVEPQVTINGQSIAYIAKGSTSQVKIEVLEDQKLETLTLSGDVNIQGVSLSSVSEPKFDPIRKVNVYTATLTCGVNASTANRNKFYIQATVSREMDGEKESKSTIATAVIVDFKVDEIAIEGANDGQFTVWQNVSKNFNVEYNLLPESYKITSDQTIVNQLIENKEFFKTYHYFPERVDVNNDYQAEYYINYVKKDGAWEHLDITDRLYVVTPQNNLPYDDATLTLPFTITKSASGSIQFKGTQANATPVEMILYTYLIAGGIQTTIETRFTVVVKTYSDPDLPLPIKTAEDFLKLDPSKENTAETIEPHDYILENDIVLENYIPFNTSLIRSLDGNGYTIYIKSFDLETPSALNLALFTEVTSVAATSTAEATDTTLKNLRVNYYNGGQLVIDISRHKEVNIAGIAITNSGVITNCEVVSFYGEQLAGESIAQVYDGNQPQPSRLHSAVTGFNVSYRDGANTSQEAPLAFNSDWSSNIAGFVLNNAGSITNSRVGGDEVYLITSASSTTGEKNVDIQELDNFSIVGQGNIAGFVLNNSGAISSSFAKNIGIKNNSASTSFFSAGFVGQNSSNAKIITSYIEGVKSFGAGASGKKYNYANTGSSLHSNMGAVAGFIYQNQGQIKDSYSNILISNSTDLAKVYLASGFVYENEGYLENCYSASQVANANYSQMNFSGVDQNGDLRTVGNYTNCYFFNVDLYVEEAQEVVDTSTETQYNTGALLIRNPSIASSFYGFAIAETGDTHKDGIWVIDETYGIKLVEPDYISVSHRYKNYIASADGETPSLSEDIVDENGNLVTLKYILPYATLVVGNTKKIDTSLGGSNNPIIIADAQDWQDISGASKSSVISEHLQNNNISGVYRLVRDIDLSLLKQDLLSTSKTFSGALYGNGFTISGISISQSNEDVLDSDVTSIGLFAKIVKKSSSSLESSKSPALVSNVNIEIVQVTAGNVSAVGGLAGVAKDASLINIDVAFTDDSIVEGLHYAGGLVGFAYGNNKLKNIVVTNPNVLADTRTEDEGGRYYIESAQQLSSLRTQTATDINKTLKTAGYSYAGGVAGFVDNYTDQNNKGFENELNQTIKYEINNIKVEGNVNVKGQVVGGLFGIAGYGTNINDAGLIINADAEASSKIASTRYFAGGIVGQSFGRLSRVYAGHENSVQEAIEDEMADFYAGDTSAQRGVLDLFDTSKTDSKNHQIAVGGLIGYAGSGLLEISYSKVNVTALSAKYAGGIVGFMDVAKVQTPYAVAPEALYTSSSSSDAQKETTKYFINEVFATGDVRANEMAGGLIGAIKGKNSDIKLLAVNALNYITLYNYQTETYEEPVAGRCEISSALKINSFVGKFLYEDSYGFEREEAFVERRYEKSANNNQTAVLLQSGADSLDGYISFLLGRENYGSIGEEGAGGVERLATVGRYNYYSFDGNKVYLKRFGENLLISNQEYLLEQENKIDFETGMGANELNIYSIASPDQYTSSTVGRTYTQMGFINSGVWSYANWYHPLDDLFPSVKLQEIYNVVYLDVYNAAEIFEKMSNSDMVVIVRGLKTATSDVSQLESYSDIKIYKNEDGSFYVLQADGVHATSSQSHHFNAIRGFSGKIIGGRYPQGATSKVKIVSHAGNFIDSVAEGFAVSDQTFRYEKVKTLKAGSSSPDEVEYIAVKNSLFVDGSIAGADISNLTLEIASQVVTTAESDGGNYGLVATSIQSTNIDTLSIVDVWSYGEDKALFRVQTGVDSLSSTTNVGLVAGQLIQNSEEKLMIVRNLAVSKTYFNSGAMPLIDVDTGTNGKAVADLNVGGYFGLITKAAEAGRSIEELRVYAASYAANRKAQFILQSATVNNVLNVGGFAGTITDVDSLTVQTDLTMSSDIEYKLPETVKDLRIGNLVATLANGAALRVDGGSATIKSSLAFKEGSTNDANVDNAYIGGLVGHHSGAPLTLTNFTNVTFDVQNLICAREAVLGGLVGYTNAQLDISSNEAVEISGNVNVSCEETAGEIVVGSVVGKTDATVALDGANTSKSLSIVGDITSTLNANITAKNATFGGIVGQIKSANAEGGAETGPKSGIIAQIGDGGRVLSYNGSVTSQNAQSVKFGGIVGEFDAKGDGEDNTVELAINKTSFGGHFTIKNSQAATITVGGTIGSVCSDNAIANIQLFRGYNYGNVYVEYDATLISLAEYNFGGIIGEVGAAKYTISENYSAVSSHNSRYLSSSNRAHALFGYGDPTVNVGGFKTTNFYSHAVCLLTDDNGTDIGYKTSYSDERLGYDRTESLSDENDIISAILAGTGKTLEQLGADTAGHKLNPKELKNTTSVADLGKTDTETDHVFEKLTYYVLKENITISNKTFKLTDAAVVGDGFKVNFENTSAAIPALFTDATGYAYISSLIEEVSVKFDDSQNVQVAGLAVRFGGNTQIYAVNAYGNMDVHSSTKNVFVSGLGQDIAGKVADSSTDIDMIGRMANNACTQAHEHNSAWYDFSQLTGFVDTSYPSEANGYAMSYIENCFALGSVQTLAGNKIWPFVQPNSKGDYKTKTQNCYSATRIDYRNYLDLADAAVVSEYSGASAANVYFNSSVDNAGVMFDLDSLNLAVSNSAIQTFNYKDINSIFIDATRSEDKKVWIRDMNFNYYYPTLKYQYLKMSSYSTQSEPILDCGHETCDQSTYDCYVKNYTYTRVPNGLTLNTENLSKGFYMITHAGALAERLAEAKDGHNGWQQNYAIKYDMDLSIYDVDSDATTTRVSPLKDITFTGKLDGQGKTIRGLTHNLFAAVGSDETSTDTCYVRNLRLTGANVVNVDGILAKTITKAEVSNMTIGGLMTIDSTYADAYVGALAGISYSAEINTTTSTTQIKVEDCQHGIDVGGIVGKAETSTNIRYCSNYGPISVTHSVANQQSTVGGVVGAINYSNVYNSYNAASVLNNYKGSVVGTFFTGGIAGHADVDNAEGETNNCTIDGCYNSGMIKSGHKGNKISGTTTDADGNTIDTNIFANNTDLNRGSHAGGILAFQGDSGDVAISNCYNEGTVEALAENGTFEVVYEEPYVKINQTSSQNVVAYAIGPGANNTCIAKIEENADGRTSVLANGAATAKDTAVYRMTYDANTWVPEYNYNNLYYATAWARSGKNHYVGAQIRYYRIAEPVRQENGVTTHSFSIVDKENTRNFLNLPLNVVYTADYRLGVMMYADQARKLKNINPDRLLSLYNYSSGSVIVCFVGAKGDFTERFSMPVNALDGLSSYNGTLNQYDNILANYIHLAKPTSDESIQIKNKEFGLQGELSNGTKTAEEIKQETKTRKSETNETLKVGGTKFYLASNNNLDIFQAGLNKNNFTVTIKKQENVSYQVSSVKTRDTNKNLHFGNIGEWIDDGANQTTTLDVYFAESDISQAITVQVAAEYRNNVEIDVSNLSFYTTDYGIGLGITDEQWKTAITTLNRVDIQDANDNTYNAYEITAASHSLSTGDALYLVYDYQFDDFVYIPNAKSVENGTKVNTISLADLNGLSWKVTLNSQINTEVMKFTNGMSYSASLNVEPATIIQYQETIIGTNKILPNNLAGNVLALNGDTVVAGSSNGGETWYGAEKVELVNIANGQEIQLVEPVHSVSSDITSTASGTYGFAINQSLVEFFDDAEKTLTKDGVKIENVEYSLNGNIVTISGLEPNEQYSLNYTYPQIYRKVATVDQNNVISWETDYSDSPDNILRIVDAEGTELARRTEGIWDNNVEVSIRYRANDATRYIQEQSATWNTTYEKEYSVSDYTITVSYRATESSVVKTYRNEESGVEININYSTTVDYDTIVGYEIIKEHLPDELNYIGVFTLQIGDRLIEHNAFVETSEYQQQLNEGEEVSIEENAELRFTAYQTHRFEKEFDQYSVSLYSSATNEWYGYDYVKDNNAENGYTEQYYKYAVERHDYGEDGTEDLISTTDLNGNGDWCVVENDVHSRYVYVNDLNYQAISMEDFKATVQGTLKEETYVETKDSTAELVDIIGVTLYPSEFSYVAEEQIETIMLSNAAVAMTVNNLAYTDVEYKIESQLDKKGYEYALDNASAKATITIYAKSFDNLAKESFVIIGSNTISMPQKVDEDWILTKSNTIEINPIIFNCDVSLGFVENSAELSVDIIGNGYNLIYNGKSLYSKTTQKINGLNILAEVEVSSGNHSYLFQDGIDGGSLSDINMYGTINISTSAITGDIENILINNASGEVENVATYVGIDSSYYNGSLTLAKQQNITRKEEVYVAADGRDRFLYRKENNLYSTDNNLGTQSSECFKIYYTGGDLVNQDAKGNDGENKAYANYNLKKKDFTMCETDNGYKYSLDIYVSSRLAFTKSTSSGVNEYGYTNGYCRDTYFAGKQLLSADSIKDGVIEKVSSPFTDWETSGRLNKKYTDLSQDSNLIFGVKGEDNNKKIILDDQGVSYDEWWIWNKPHGMANNNNFSNALLTGIDNAGTVNAAPTGIALCPADPELEYQQMTNLSFIARYGK